MPKPECFVNKKGTVQCTIVQTNYLLLELFLLPVMNCDRGFVSYSNKGFKGFLYPDILGTVMAFYQVSSIYTKILKIKTT